MKQRASKCALPTGAKVLSSPPNHQYADAFALMLAPSDARGMVQLMAARGTGRPERILASVRDALVKPFGLKPIGMRAMAPFERTAHDTDEVIYAIDDRHVDVRIGYRCVPVGAQRQLVATTLVRVHHTLGWLYLVAILPFHFLIVKRQLERIAAHANNS